MNKSKVKKILFLLSGNFYGSNRVFLEMAKVLRSQGLEVTIVVPIFTCFSHRKITLASNRPNIFASARYYLSMLYHEVVRTKFKWILDENDLAGIKIIRCLARPTKRMLKNQDAYILANNWYQAYDFDWPVEKTFLYIHHLEIPSDSPEIDANYIMPIYKKFKNISTCDYTRNNIEKAGVDCHGITFLGVNPKYFFSKKQNYNQEVKTIAVYKGLPERKGWKYGEEAIKQIKAKYPHIEIVVLSPMHVKDMSPDLTYKTSLSNAELGECLRDVDIYIYPSLFEGFGLPPLEAMGCGCAVVTTKVGAVQEYSNHLDDTYLIDSESSEQIVDAVEFLINHPSERAQIRKNAALNVAERFTWRETADSLVLVLDTNVQS